MRVRAYVDGFNLYYRALKGTRHKWLNLHTLVRSLLHEKDEVLGIHYFTARVKLRAGKENAPRDQQVYLSALATLPALQITYGSFLSKPITRPMVDEHDRLIGRYARVLTSEEKGSDVNLAVHMLNDALHDRYDAALLLSQDTDLCECMRLVRAAGKMVGIVSLDGQRPNPGLRQHASFVKTVTSARLAAAQFPPLIEHQGKRIVRPDTW